MKRCMDCKDEACPKPQGPDSVACEDFTSEAIEEESVEWQPTLDDWDELSGIRDRALSEITKLDTRLAGYERAVAELVKWAQGDETP